MVKIKKNIVTKGWSGKLGDDIVFRKKGNQTYVALSPTKTNREPSEKQKAQNQKFKLAIVFAKAQMADPAKKERYDLLKTEFKSAFNIAVADFLRPPDITDVDVGAYAGQVGDLIRIAVIDNVEVTEVNVEIRDDQDALIEQGAANLDVTGAQWEYATTVANGSLSGTKILVTAKDYPGNVTIDETVLP